MGWGVSRIRVRVRVRVWSGLRLGLGLGFRICGSRVGELIQKLGFGISLGFRCSKASSSPNINPDPEISVNPNPDFNPNPNPNPDPNLKAIRCSEFSVLNSRSKVTPQIELKMKPRIYSGLIYFFMN